MPQLHCAKYFVNADAGKGIVFSVQNKLNVLPHRANSIVSRAFLGDDDMRSVVEHCHGQVDWCDMIASTNPVYNDSDG